MLALLIDVLVCPWCYYPLSLLLLLLPPLLLLLLLPPPPATDRQKLLYHEFGACSFNTYIAPPNNTTTTTRPGATPLSSSERAKIASLFEVDDTTLPIKVVVPPMVGNYYGTITLSKSGRLRYSVNSGRDGAKRQWLEIKPVK